MPQETYSPLSLSVSVSEDRLPDTQYAPTSNLLLAASFVISLLAQQHACATPTQPLIYGILGGFRDAAARRPAEHARRRRGSI